MKSIKLLLAAFALSATFAACSKEESPAIQELQRDQFIGADLIGKNVSMNVGTDADTRVNGTTGNFENGDKTGLGWIVTNKGYDKTQEIKDALAGDHKLYANHMYIREDGQFVSKGNLYQGWHFAYFPFQYQPILGQPLSVTINPEQTEEYATDAVNTVFNVSARNFLTPASLNADYQLKNDVNFTLYRAVNTIKVTVKPDATLKGSDVLSKSTINSITISTGKKATAKVFPAATVNLVPENLPVWTDTLTKKGVYAKLPEVLANNMSSNEISTAVKNDNFNLSGDQVLRIYTLPCNAEAKGKTINAEDVKIIINVDGGTITVPYETDDELTPVQEDNNDAIQALVDAYMEEDGLMTAYGLGTLKLEFVLTGDMFDPNFDAISSEAEWNHAVAVANALELVEPVFTLVNDEEDGVYEWSFNSLPLPEKGVTVAGDPIVLGAKMEWPTVADDDYDFTVSTKVVVNAELTVNNTMKATEIVNNAVINAGAESSISTDSARKLNNTNGRVIAAYGAEVYPTNEKEGTIAYVIEDALPTSITKVNDMMKYRSYTAVNTFIVKTALDINAKANDKANNTHPYGDNSVKAAYLEDDFENYYIELDGGSLTHNTPAATSERNDEVLMVTAVAGENAINDVVVTTDIVTKEGAVLNVNNTVAASSKAYFVNDIINEGTLNSSVAVLIADNIDNSKGSLNVDVDANSYVLYTEEYIQGGTVSGWVLEQASSAKATSSDYTYDNVNNEFTVKSKYGMMKLQEEITSLPTNLTIKLANNIDMAGIYWTGLVCVNKSVEFDGQGYTIKNLMGNSGLFTYNLQNDMEPTRLSVSDLTIDGANIHTTAKYAALVVAKTHGALTDITVKNSVLTGENQSGSYAAIVALHGEGNITNCDVDNVTINGGKKVAGVAACINEKAQTVKDCDVANSNFNTSAAVAAKNAIKGAVVGQIAGAGLTFSFDKCTVTNTTPSALYGKADDDVKKVNVK